MILLSRASQSKQKREIFEHTRGILFFGTRHSGKYSDSLWFYPRWILGTISFLQMHFHIDDMPSLSLLGDQDIERSNAQFSPLLTKLHISCFYNERYGLLDRVFYTTSVSAPS
jgi:hypothetical protein